MDFGENELSQEITPIFKERASQIPIDAIGLPTRARNVLISLGAKNSYEAVQLTLSELSESTGVGVKTVSETRSAVYKFINEVALASDEKMKLYIDPREEFLSSTNGNLVEAFPAIVELYLSKKKSSNIKRDTDVLKKRFGLSGNRKYTLEDLGAFYDVTRERIRQVEAKSIKELRLVLIDELKRCTWKLSHKIYKAYASFLESLKEYEWLILKEDIEHVFADKFGDKLSEVYLELFMEVSGYTKLPKNIIGFRGEISEAWCVTEKYEKHEIESVFQALDHIYDRADSLPVFDLIVGAKRKSGKKSNISNDSIKIALSATKDIEFQEDHILVKFSRLRSASDKAFRVLESSGKPMHFSKIAQEINFLSKSTIYSDLIKETNLKNQLVADKRFVPIGKSGEWALAYWNNVTNITIMQAIENVLHSEGKPLKFTEIKLAVEKIRPDASLNSLKVYLSDQSIFSRVGRGEYALSAWRLQPAEKSKKSESISVSDFNESIKAVISIKNPVELSELIRAVSISTGLSEVSVRQRICTTKALQITQENGRRNKIVHCKDTEKLSSKFEERPLLLNQVQQEIRSILFEKPNIPMKKGDLFKLVTKNVECIRPTFYQYLERMSDIQKFKEGNNFYAVYMHNEDVEKIEIDITKYTTCSKTISLLGRPLSFLTIDNVDIALFELGLIFETSIKDYLKNKNESGLLNINSKDIAKLVNMIDCVVREGIVTKGHHLNTLREERNNRAHGKTPSIQERKDLFNKAHYIADLFVKYICFFRDNG
ncbi:sigma factor-like helix-turn-helix DNA-binding protein [Shewanella morhuae]|nr:sigma factor-like helix-turn-helix DNA-binding protein [Shewanella morhuae]